MPKKDFFGVNENPTRFPSIEHEFEHDELHPTLYNPLVLTVEPSSRVKVICSIPPHVLAQQKYTEVTIFGMDREYVVPDEQFP